jgi:CRISPR-associated protein Cas2
MVVFLVERVPTALRGELTRWLLELKPGVFVGTVSADVRDRLWQYVIERTQSGAAYLVHAAQTEQRFAIRTHGSTSREIVDFDGVQLVRVRTDSEGELVE